MLHHLFIESSWTVWFRSPMTTSTDSRVFHNAEGMGVFGEEYTFASERDEYWDFMVMICAMVDDEM